MPEGRPRKAPGKMRLFLLSNDGQVLACSDEGDISDSTLRVLVEQAGIGHYQVVTGRLRTVSFSKREVTDFKIE